MATPIPTDMFPKLVDSSYIPNIFVFQTSHLDLRDLPYLRVSMIAYVSCRSLMLSGSISLDPTILSTNIKNPRESADFHLAHQKRCFFSYRLRSVRGTSCWYMILNRAILKLPEDTTFRTRMSRTTQRNSPCQPPRNKQIQYTDVKK